MDTDWKEYVAPPADMSQLADAILETTCPGCGHLVGALIVDGPDPVFADVVCPRDVCQHEFSERVS